MSSPRLSASRSPVKGPLDGPRSSRIGSGPDSLRQSVPRNGSAERRLSQTTPIGECAPPLPPSASASREGDENQRTDAIFHPCPSLLTAHLVSDHRTNGSWKPLPGSGRVDRIEQHRQNEEVPAHRRSGADPTGRNPAPRTRLARARLHPRGAAGKSESGRAGRTSPEPPHRASRNRGGEGPGVSRPPHRAARASPRARRATRTAAAPASHPAADSQPARIPLAGSGTRQTSVVAACGQVSMASSPAFRAVWFPVYQSNRMRRRARGRPTPNPAAHAPA